MGEWSLVAPQVSVWGFLVVWVHCKFAVVFVFQVGVALVFWFPSQVGLPSSPCACILSFLAFGFQFGVALVFGFVFGFWFSSCLGLFVSSSELSLYLAAIFGLCLYFDFGFESSMCVCSILMSRLCLVSSLWLGFGAGLGLCW